MKLFMKAWGPIALLKLLLVLLAPAVVVTILVIDTGLDIVASYFAGREDSHPWLSEFAKGYLSGELFIMTWALLVTVTALVVGPVTALSAYLLSITMTIPACLASIAYLLFMSEELGFAVQSLLDWVHPSNMEVTVA